jgi:hypothetical protein
MALTNPINSTNISNTYHNNGPAFVSITYYFANKPFADFDVTIAGGVILGGDSSLRNFFPNGYGSGQVISGSDIVNLFTSVTRLHTNFRTISPRRGVTRTDSRTRPATNTTDFTNYTSGRANLPIGFRRTIEEVRQFSGSLNLTGTINSTRITEFFGALYNSWITLTQDAINVTVTVCHSSCHRSCHRSRSRR